MIGYYVHHHGRGHLHRALAVSRELDEPVTLLSSLPRPAEVPGEWVSLARDDEGGPSADHDARGRLHWVPLGDRGLSRRMRRLSDWLDDAQPRLLVVDVSVEVALLARLHGVPVVGVVLPGDRTDPAHRLGLDVADTVVAVWPPEATEALLPGLPDDVRRRVRAVGGLARYPVERPGPRRPGPPRVALLSGAGGSDQSDAAVDRVVRSTPGWEWTVLGPGRWLDDPRPVLRDADVVVTHAGQNAVAEVAALRRPAVVVPQERPHDEQRVSAAALRHGPWPVLVEDSLPLDGWPERLERAAALEGSRWGAWCDGRAAARFADVLHGAVLLEEAACRA